jgi:hypothetical protein
MQGADPREAEHYSARVSGTLRRNGKMVSSVAIVSSLRRGGMIILSIFQNDKASRENPRGAIR